MRVKSGRCGGLFVLLQPLHRPDNPRPGRGERWCRWMDSALRRVLPLHLGIRGHDEIYN